MGGRVHGQLQLLIPRDHVRHVRPCNRAGSGFGSSYADPWPAGRAGIHSHYNFVNSVTAVIRAPRVYKGGPRQCLNSGCRQDYDTGTQRTADSKPGPKDCDRPTFSLTLCLWGHMGQYIPLPEYMGPFLGRTSRQRSLSFHWYTMTVRRLGPQVISVGFHYSPDIPESRWPMTTSTGCLKFVSSLAKPLLAVHYPYAWGLAYIYLSSSCYELACSR
jgi:hypothetical protein